MTVEEHLLKQKQLEQAIAAQELLRGVIDDSIIDTTIAALRKQLTEILSSPHNIEQQRKMATVLFMDIVNSTKMIQKMDPEESMEILDVSLHSLAKPVQKYGGHINRFMGDGFLAVFGLPNARENDPEMAVRAALDILSATRKIAASLENERSIKGFQVRIGINTGLIAAGGITESTDTIMGTTVNLAARLEKAADPGTILVSIHTYQHIRGIFDMEQRNPIDAKGFTEPVETYRILQARSRDFRLMNRGVEGVDTRMVGREHEMLLVQEICRAVIRKNEGRFITILGEAGLGKSRFLDEFESWLELQPIHIRLFKGRATLETQNQPYALFRDMFARDFNILESDSVQIVRQKFLDGFLQDFQNNSKSEMRSRLVGHLLGYDFSDSTSLQHTIESPQIMRDQAYQHLKTYYHQITTQTPVAIFLDDLHWADESSMDLLSYLGGAFDRSPVLFFVLTRPVLFERRKGWGRGEGFETIPLSPLSHEQSERLVAEVLKKVDNVPISLRELIIEHAEGNPYYIEEMIRMLVEDGIIIKQEPVWHIQPNRINDLRIPSTLTGIIQARLDSLPKVERNILQQASVVGRVFWDDAVTYINHGRPFGNGNIAQYLESLQIREMVFQRKPSAFSDALEYIFKHGIFRDVAYETVLLRHRKKYHGLVANWLIDQRRDRVVEMSGLIANHLVKAGRSTEAIDYFQQAAEIAARKYSNEEAVDLYQQALELTPEDAVEKRFSILLGLEGIWNLLGDRHAQEGALKNLELAADQLADQHKKADVFLRKAWFLFGLSDFSEMLKVVQQTINLAKKIEYSELIQEALYAETWANIQLENFDIAEKKAQKSLELTLEAGDHIGEGNVHNVLGMIGLSRGRYAEARKHIEKFLGIARETQNQNRELTALNNLVTILISLGEYEAASDYGIQMLNLALEVGDRLSESSAYINLAWGASTQRKWKAAEEYIMKGLALKRDMQHLEAVAEGLVWLGYIRLGFHQLEGAEKAFRESLEIRQELEQEVLQAESISGLSRTLLEFGDIAAAQEHVERIIGFISRDENLYGSWEPLRIYWTCYEVLKVADDSRKDEILIKAANNLQMRAAKIPDKTARERYLTNVPWHRAIMTEWMLVCQGDDSEAQK